MGKKENHVAVPQGVVHNRHSINCAYSAPSSAQLPADRNHNQQVTEQSTEQMPILPQPYARRGRTAHCAVLKDLSALDGSDHDTLGEVLLQEGVDHEQRKRGDDNNAVLDRISELLTLDHRLAVTRTTAGRGDLIRKQNVL